MKRMIVMLVLATLTLTGVSDAKKKKKHPASGTSILMGQVIGDHGRAAHHARVTIRHARRHHRRRLSANAGGHFTVGLGPAGYRVSAREGASSGAKWVTVSAGGTTSVVITLHRAGPHAVYGYARHHLGVRRRHDHGKHDHKKAAAKPQSSSKSKSAAGTKKH